VRDVMRVAVAQRLHYLDEDPPGIFLGEVAVGVEAVEELSSFAEAT
jgi:hypothetical protein